MTTQSPTPAYVKLLNLLQAIREIPAFPKLDTVEEKLLGLAADAANGRQPLTVVDAMESVPGASPSTVHRRLKALLKKDMIEFGADAHDFRIKYVLLTPRAVQYFATLSDCVRKAARE